MNRNPTPETSCSGECLLLSNAAGAVAVTGEGVVCVAKGSKRLAVVGAVAVDCGRDVVCWSTADHGFMTPPPPPPRTGAQPNAASPIAGSLPLDTPPPTPPSPSPSTAPCRARPSDAGRYSPCTLSCVLPGDDAVTEPLRCRRVPMGATSVFGSDLVLLRLSARGSIDELSFFLGQNQREVDC